MAFAAMDTSVTPLGLRHRSGCGRHTEFPVLGCGGGGADAWTMYRHFAYRHPRAQVCVVGVGLVGQCTMCGMFVPKPNLHDSTQMCKQLRKRRENEAAMANQASAKLIQFYVNSGKIERVIFFCYLGRLLAEDDDDTACICAQIQKARAC